MPRPLLSRRENRVLNQLEVNKSRVSSKSMNPLKLEERLREKRSKEYIDAIRNLDSGDCSHRHGFQEFIDCMKEEFSDIPTVELLVGVVAKCYLGEPYEVHALDMAGNILQHYKTNEPLPVGLEKARSLANHGSYEFIEVYSNHMVAIDHSGNASIIK